MKELIIAGAGMSALISAKVFSSIPGIRIRLLEPATIGGEFLTGGLKYIHYTSAMAQFLLGLKVNYTKYTLKGGILYQGVVRKFPEFYQKLTSEQARRIQEDHYRKTRMCEPSDSRTAMNDPANGKSKKALALSFEDMISALVGNIESKGARIIKDRLKSIRKRHVVTAGGKMLAYDYLILTIPLWVISSAAYWHVPSPYSMMLNIVKLTPQADEYGNWDYVYTPYTPGNCVHRFSPDGLGYALEVNGDIKGKFPDVISDINFLFGAGWHTNKITVGLKGHLLPLSESVEWPKNIAPLGRFAKWDSRATLDVVLQDAIILRNRWFGHGDD